MPLSCKIMAFCLGVSTILSRRRLSHPTRVWRRFFVPSTLRRNFSLVTRYSLKFTRCSLLVVKSLVTRCKICSLLVAEVARSKKSLITRCKIRSLLVAEVARCKNSLVTRCKIRSLLVAEVARCKKSLVTRCRSCSLQKILQKNISTKKYIYYKNKNTNKKIK